MNVLLDTNILIRMAQPSHSQYRVAKDAAALLVTHGDNPCIVPQGLYEFWAVATRPVTVNGLGFSITEAQAELTRLKTLFPIFADTAAIYPEWERLVTSLNVVGKNAHDARFVAAMKIHGLTHLLTFNTQDFVRFPGVTVLDPAGVVGPTSSP